MIFLRLRETISSSPGRRDKIILTNLIVGLAINVVLWALVLYGFRQATDYIVLRYNVYFGISSLGPWFYILLLPLAGLVVLGLNGFLAIWLYMRFRFLSYVLAWGASVINLILLVAIGLLVYINI